MATVGKIFVLFFFISIINSCQMADKKNRVKTLRLPDSIIARVNLLAQGSTMDESEIYRQAIIAGMQRIESGEYNPFTDGKIAETPPAYGEVPSEDLPSEEKQALQNHPNVVRVKNLTFRSLIKPSEKKES